MYDGIARLFTSRSMVGRLNPKNCTASFGEINLFSTAILLYHHLQSIHIMFHIFRQDQFSFWQRPFDECPHLLYPFLPELNFVENKDLPPLHG